MNAAAIAVYNLSILAGCAYLVGWHDWSPWWFLFALCVLMSESDESDDK